MVIVYWMNGFLSMKTDNFALGGGKFYSYSIGQVVMVLIITGPFKSLFCSLIIFFVYLNTEKFSI